MSGDPPLRQGTTFMYGWLWKLIFLMCLTLLCELWFIPFTENFDVVYLDDILVYNKPRVQHLEHLWQVFKILRSKSFLPT